MLLDLGITPSTIVVLAAIAAGAIFAIRRLVKRGLCDCSDKCDSCASCAKKRMKGSCNGCSAVENMVKRMEAICLRK